MGIYCDSRTKLVKVQIVSCSSKLLQLESASPLSQRGYIITRKFSFLHFSLLLSQQLMIVAYRVLV